jgi:hypothetical protein
VRAKHVLDLALSGALTALAACALSAGPALAGEPFLRACKKLPSGYKGLWNSSTCEGTKVSSGEYAWAWAEGAGGETNYCVLGGSGYTEDLCETGGSGSFLIRSTNEPFPKLYGLLLLSSLHSKVAGAAALVTCEAGQTEGQPLAGSLISGLTLEYTGCSVQKPAKCSIAGPPGGTTGIIKTKTLIGELEGLEVNFRPASGTTWVELEYKNKGTETCPLNGDKVTLSGAQSCADSGHPETPALDHTIECKGSGSSLKLGTEPATYEGLAHVHLLGNLSWQIALCSSACTKHPTITVLPAVSNLGTLSLKLHESGEQVFEFENHGPGEWRPGPGRVVELIEPMGSEGAFDFLIPPSPCANAIVAEDDECEVAAELDPDVLGNYSMSVRFAFSPRATLTGEAVE